MISENLIAIGATSPLWIIAVLTLLWLKYG